ncbi:hypothetical protein RyT2_29530 [Pseudolactococcus yaeyamensis]
MSRITLDQVESSERFYRIPKIFFDETSYYWTMRLESKFAYGLLKDRFELSKQNKWVNKENQVYLNFKVKDLEKLLNCKKDKVHQIKNELAQYGLLEEERMGLNKANRIYVLNIDTTRTSEKPTSNETSDTKDVGISDIQTSEKPTSRSRKNRRQDICNSDTNDTEYSDTEFSDTDNKKEDDEDENKKESDNSLREIAEDRFKDVFELLDTLKFPNKGDAEAIKSEMSDELLKADESQIVYYFKAAWEYTQENCTSDSYFAQYLIKNMQMQANKNELNTSKTRHEDLTAVPLSDDYFASVDALRVAWGYEGG